MRVAIVHHWFVTRGGGERVAECIASLFPEAEVFTLMAARAGTPAGLRGRRIRTSFLQWVPAARHFHRHMLPLYPAAVERLDLRGFDLVISSDSGPVKGVLVDAGAVHLCYCHSPMRYLYDGYAAYRGRMGTLIRTLFTMTARRLREWDMRAAGRVTAFIANSEYVKGRIRRFYGRESTVIHPPIDLERAAEVVGTVPGRHYLCAGRLVGYKRTELIVEACRRLGRELRVAGTGPEERHLRKIAAAGKSGGTGKSSGGGGAAELSAGSGIVFLKELSTKALWQEYAGCRALLFAADEDFGMVPLEAQACGRPVVAYGAGGSLETVRGLGTDGVSVFRATGVYFREQTVESVMAGILAFEEAESAGRFDAEMIRGWAAQFGTPVFLRRMRDFVLSQAPGAGEVMVAAEGVEVGV